MDRCPQLGRCGLAEELSGLWQWRSANGRLKARSALAVLVELERRKQIILPEARAGRGHSPPRRIGVVRVEGSTPTPLAHALEDCLPLDWRLIQSTEGHREWNDLLDRYHYLGAPAMVGASLKFLVRSRDGELLGALGWQSAVQNLGCRDRLVGWDYGQRAQGLQHGVNGIRFLILPWVRVRHLASVMLSQGLRQMRKAWQARYASPVWWVESFVDGTRFNGASYRAANWIGVGWTRGFAKQQGHFVHHGRIKEVYIYVIKPQLRRWVHQDEHQPLLTRAFLLAQREVERKSTFGRREQMKNLEEKWQSKVPRSWNLEPEDLESVGAELSSFCSLFGEAFVRIETRELCELYLRGLLSNTERKNVEAMALELAGPEAVRNLQRFIGQHRCDEDLLARRHWEEVAATLSSPLGVFCIDASDIEKKGPESVGVAPQYCGSAGKTANCQSGVYVSYVSPAGHALIESQLYMPECWFADSHKDRRQECRVPEDLKFETKPALANRLVTKVLSSGLFEGRWIACDCSFGNNEAFLRQLPDSLWYMAEIACTRKVWPRSAPGHPHWETDGCTVEELVSASELIRWETQRVSEGEKGPLVAGFARVRVYSSKDRKPEEERWLFLRNDPNLKIKYAFSNAPESCAMSEMIRVSGARWTIERCFAEDKGELGLDHYEHRSWTAWHRHMRLTFLAQLFLIRLRTNLLKKKDRPDTAPSQAPIGVELTSSTKGIELRIENCGILSGAKPMRL